MTVRSLSRVAAACLVALALAGCGGDSDEKLLASAKGYLQKDDRKAAIIQLKTLLQQNPKSGEGRLLLGKALRDSGDVAGALVELRKAQELAVPDDQLVPELARTLLLAGEGQKVAGQFATTTLKDPQAAADLAVSLATAWALQGDTAKAQAAADRALQLQPGFVPAVVMQARLKAQAKDYDGALAVLDGVLAQDPKQAAAAMLKGEVLWQGKRDREAALAHYRQVLTAQPKAVAAHTAVVSLLFELERVDEANAALATLVGIAPNHPDTVFLQARSAVLKKDYPVAREMSARLLKAAPENALVLEIAGLAEMGLNSNAQAETLLQRALKVAPERPLARHALSRLYLRQGDGERAMAMLQPLLDATPPDVTALTAAGEAMMQQGDVARADGYFRRASQAAPNDPRVRTTIALAQMARGDTAGAATALQALVADDKTPRADLALVAARMRQNDIPGALKAVDGMRAKAPTSPLPEQLAGRLLQLKKDEAGAAAAYEAALKKDPTYFPAVASLAGMDFAAGKPDAARQRLEALAKADPRSYQARIALAELATRTDAPNADVTRLIAEAVKAAPVEPRARVLQVRWLLRQGDAKAALVAAQDALAALPDHPDVLDVLGSAQVAGGEAQQALTTFRKLATLQPKNPTAQMRLADAYLAARDNDAARVSLRRALELDPDLVPAQRGLARLAVADRRYDEALAIAREAQKRKPKSAAGFQLEGEIEASRKAWPAATAALRAALQREKTTEAAIALHRTLVQSAPAPEGARFAAEWLKDKPNDAAFIYHLGDAALARQDWADAEKQYRAVMALQPRNGMAINNVAWLLARDKRPGAVAMAEQALKVLPDAAPVLDTLALALAAEGQLPKAIETQKRAIQRAPADPTLKLALAKLYLQSGDKLQARTELTTLQALGDKFSGQPQVAELLKTLQ